MRHVIGANREQGVLFPEQLDDYVSPEHPVRVIDAFVDSLDLPAGESLDYKGTDYRRQHHLYRRRGCGTCELHRHCTTGNTRAITRHLFEKALNRSQARVDANPGLMPLRMSIVERPCAMIKQIMGFRRLGCRGLSGAHTEVSLEVLSYNLKTMIGRVGVTDMLARLA